MCLMLSDSRLACSFSEQGAAPVIRILSADTGLDVQEPLVGHLDDITCVDALPSGSLLISGSDDNTIWAWDASTGKRISHLVGHSRAVMCVKLLPDGRRAVSTANDGTLRLWDVLSGFELTRLKATMETISWKTSVTCVSLSADGTLAATCSDRLRLWDLTSPGPVLDTLAAAGTLMEVFPDEKHVAISGGIRTEIHILDITGETAGQIDLRDHTHHISCLCVLPDGQLASGSLDNTVMLWDWESSLAPSATLQMDIAVSAMCTVPGDDTLLVVAGDTQLQVRDLQDWEVVAQLTGHTGTITALVCSRDGQHLVSASLDGTMRVWDVDNATEVGKMEGHGGNLVKALHLTAESNRLVSCSKGLLLVSDMLTRKHVARAEEDVDGPARISPDGKCILSLNRSGTAVMVWDIETCSPMHSLDSPGWDPFCGLCALPGKNMAIAFDGARVHGWQLSPGGELFVELCTPDDLMESVMTELPGQAKLIDVSRQESRLEAWGLSFEVYMESVLRVCWGAGAEDAESPTAQFHLPIYGRLHAVLLYLKERHLNQDPGGEDEEDPSLVVTDVLVTVFSSVDSGRTATDRAANACLETSTAVYRQWLCDMPRWRLDPVASPSYFQKLQPVSDLGPQLGAIPSILASPGTGAGANRSLVHYLAACKDSSRHVALKGLQDRGVAGLVRLRPHMAGLMRVRDDLGRLPLEIALWQATPSRATCVDIISAHGAATALCRKMGDISGLRCLLDSLVQCLPRMRHLDLELDLAWDILDRSAAVTVCEHFSAAEVESRVFLEEAHIPPSDQSSGSLVDLLIFPFSGPFLPFTNSGMGESHWRPPGFVSTPTSSSQTPWKFMLEHMPESRFAMPFARAAVEYRMAMGGKQLQFMLVAFHLVFLACFTALMFVTKAREPLGAVQYALLVPLCVWGGINIFIELRELFTFPAEYLTTIWNYIDLPLYLCVPPAAAGVLTSHWMADSVMAWAMVLCWLKLISFMRVYKDSAGIVRMISLVVIKTSWFVVVLLFLLVGFSLGTHAILPDQQGLPSQDFHITLLRQFRLMFADFGVYEYDDLLLYTEQVDAFGNTVDYLVNVSMSILFIYLVAIIMFNLLISVLGEIYESVRESELAALTSFRALSQQETEADFRPVLDLFLSVFYCSGWVLFPESPRSHMLHYWVDVSDDTWMPSVDQNPPEGARPIYYRLNTLADAQAELRQDLRGLRSDISDKLQSIREILAEVSLSTWACRRLNTDPQCIRLVRLTFFPFRPCLPPPPLGSTSSPSHVSSCTLVRPVGIGSGVWEGTKAPAVKDTGSRALHYTHPCGHAKSGGGRGCRERGLESSGHAGPCQGDGVHCGRRDDQD